MEDDTARGLSMGDRSPMSGASAAPDSVVALSDRSGGATITTVSCEADDPAAQSSETQGTVQMYADNHTITDTALAKTT